MSLSRETVKAYIEKFKQELQFPLYVRDDDGYQIWIDKEGSGYNGPGYNSTKEIKNITEFDLLGDKLKGLIIFKQLTGDRTPEYIADFKDDIDALFYGKKLMNNSWESWGFNCFIREHQIQRYFEENKHNVKYPLFIYDSKWCDYEFWHLDVEILVTNEYKGELIEDLDHLDCISDREYQTIDDVSKDYAAVIVFAVMQGMNKKHCFTKDSICDILDNYFETRQVKF